MGDTRTRGHGAAMMTATEVAERTGATRADVIAACESGQLPGATRSNGQRGAWAIPPAALNTWPPFIPVNHDDPATGDVDGAVWAERSEGTAAQRTASVRELVDVARRVERTQDGIGTRPSRAVPALVWRHVETAARHTQDRDGSCRHDGWPWPCPDYSDAAAAVADAAAVLLDGAQ